MVQFFLPHSVCVCVIWVWMFVETVVNRGECLSDGLTGLWDDYWSNKCYPEDFGWCVCAQQGKQWYCLKHLYSVYRTISLRLVRQITFNLSPNVCDSLLIFKIWQMMSLTYYLHVWPNLNSLTERITVKKWYKLYHQSCTDESSNKMRKRWYWT